MSAGPPIPAELWQQIPPAAQAAIRALILRYEQRVADLEARLNQNSTNSSKPPSSDPPALKRPPPKTPSVQRAGGQHGHAKAQRALHDRPDRAREYEPTTCRHCHQPLHGDDPRPEAASAGCPTMLSDRPRQPRRTSANRRRIGCAAGGVLGGAARPNTCSAKVHKLARFSREEIHTMPQVHDIRETRVCQL